MAMDRFAQRLEIGNVRRDYQVSALRIDRYIHSDVLRKYSVSPLERNLSWDVTVCRHSMLLYTCGRDCMHLPDIDVQT